MLSLDPDLRPSALECLQHPFFSGVDPTDPYQYNIIKQEPLTPLYHKLEKPNWKLEGIKQIGDLLQRLPKDPKLIPQYYRCVFLSLDLYHRVSLTTALPKTDHKIIAISCVYISFKYYLDQSSPTLNQLFPDGGFTTQQVESAEYKILHESLSYIIYRPTIFDLLSYHPLIYSKLNDLWSLLTQCLDIYNNSILDISESIKTILFSS